MDLETIVAQGLHKAGIKLTPVEFRRVTNTMVDELKANAQVVRMEMEHEIWGFTQ